MKLSVDIDTTRLVSEFQNIPENEWGVSYWDVHCSIDALLLRGGNQGNADDFSSAEVEDNPILKKLPYIAYLIDPQGPLGGAVYAFLFKTKPNGITRIHRDRKDEWCRAVRVHIPVITNPGALLLAEGRAKHFKVGEAWTFDNQSLHSVVNGDQTRVHLIIDVNPNPKLIALMQNAYIDPGHPDPENWERTGVGSSVGPVPIDVAEGSPLSYADKRHLGLTLTGFATRVNRVLLMGMISRVPLTKGDIIVAVDGISSSAKSRSALDHIRTTHTPGQIVKLSILRDGQLIERSLRLWPNYYFSSRRVLARIIRRKKSVQGY